MNRRRSERSTYRFTYYAVDRKDREIRPFQTRDAEASLFLMDALIRRGYRFADSFLNSPSPGPDLVDVDVDHVRETDLIVLVTRPPMHDRLLEDRKEIPRSHTTLEDRLFKGPLAEHFEICARSQLKLTASTAAISPEIAKRSTMLFRQHGGAMYDSYRAPDAADWTHFERRQRLTAAFLVYCEHAWPGGPAFLAAFGMGGTETLVWCRALATRFSDLLCTTSFAMAELRATSGPGRPESTGFAESWQVEILGAAPLPGLRGPRRAA